MKNFLLVASFLLLGIPTAQAQLSFPEPNGYVNDFAQILSEEAEQRITSLIEAVREKNSAEVAIVTVRSLEGNDVNYYAVEMGRAWGIGNVERDDGVLFLTALDDRKTYIATGYGTEGYITDAQAFWITDQVVVPYFRNGDYEGGILAGTEKIAAALEGLEKLPEIQNTDSDFSNGGIFFFLFFFFSFVIPWAVAVLSRSKRWWPGGLAGGILGILLAVFLSVTFLVIIPLALFGFLFDYLASKNYKAGKDKWWTGGGSSGWGGGSSFGGGSSSGGSSFGGFSGGSFGGGGGGSSW
jgi:uncharacterized protein